MTQTLLALLAAGAGACIALQATANTRFRENLDSSAYAAFHSICGTFITACSFMVLLRPSMPSPSTLRQTEWWNWIGGPLGALIVLAGATLARQLGAAAFIALVVGVGARMSNAASASIDAIRNALRLPAPRTSVTIPAGADLDVPGLTPLVTPNADFYRIDTALTVPSVDPETWRLVVDGIGVERAFRVGSGSRAAHGRAPSGRPRTREWPHCSNGRTARRGAARDVVQPNNAVTMSCV